MAGAEKAAEAGFLKHVLTFFRRDAEVNPVVNNVGSGPATRLHGIYGDRLKIYGNGSRIEELVRDLELLPDGFHRKLAAYFAQRPKGGIYIVDGPVTDVARDLRGKRPVGYPEGATFDDMIGLHREKKYQVILRRNRDWGGSTALHEAMHALDAALGRPSHSAEFKHLHGRLESMKPYFAKPGRGGQQETFAEAFSRWFIHRHKSPEERGFEIASGLGMKQNRESQGALLDSYFTRLAADLGAQ